MRPFYQIHRWWDGVGGDTRNGVSSGVGEKEYNLDVWGEQWFECGEECGCGVESDFGGDGHSVGWCYGAGWGTRSVRVFVTQ